MRAYKKSVFTYSKDNTCLYTKTCTFIYKIRDAETLWTTLAYKNLKAYNFISFKIVINYENI